MGFFNLRDALGTKQVACRVSGCHNTWTWAPEEQARAWAKGDLTPPSRMCETCYERSGELVDRPVPCSKPGCEGSWVWTRAAQLALSARKGAIAAGPPKGLCDTCRQQVKELPDRQINCRVRECKRTWTWTGRAQHLAGATDATAAPPATMCDECHELYQTLRDEERPCRVAGCTRTFVYQRWSQLEAAASGQKEPPARMCEPCLATFDALGDRDVTCRTQGCKRTWKWRRGSQLEALVAARAAALAQGKPEPGVDAQELPSRMCADCARSYGELADQELPCKVPGCKNTWTWKRGAQLKERRKEEKRASKQAATRETDSSTEPTADADAQKPADKSVEAPSRACADCQKLLDTWADKELPCSNRDEGCVRTFTWTRMAQIISLRRTGEARPPKHMCQPCAEFMKGRTTKTILCQKCSAELHWPPRSQLMTFLGKWVEPTLCGSCRAIAANG
jgi:hypothetical protein